MPDRCPICDRPLATEENRKRGDVDGTVCWWGAIPGACGGVPVDWRARCLEAEAREATLRRWQQDAAKWITEAIDAAKIRNGPRTNWAARLLREVPHA